jgi:hypothetical protein
VRFLQNGAATMVRNGALNRLNADQSRIKTARKITHGRNDKGLISWTENV